MMRLSRTSTLFFLGLAMCGVTALGLINNPGLFANLTYAAEAGKAYAAKQQLAMASDLSQAFQHVADALKPSVVSISSAKKVRAVSIRSGSPFSDLPPELRHFFGNRWFEDFDRFERIEPREDEGLVENGLGTGVIISSDGYIVTNNHVIADADEVTVTLSNDKSYEAEVIGTDKKSDLAVLKIDATGLVPAQLGNSERLRVGEWVLAIGSPFGLTQTVTAGIVSATGRQNVGVADYEDFIQTDAAINPGNSGGPLVNLQGEVVGINTAIASRSGGYMGVGFSIPSDMVKRVSDSIVENGQVERGWLGAAIQDVNEDLAASFEYDESEGVLVGDVMPESPAAEAGLQGGDIILKFNRKRMESASELRHAVAGTSPGTSVSMRVFRDGEWINLDVTVGRLDDSKLTYGGTVSSGLTDLGIYARSLTPEIAKRLSLDSDATGVVVADVDRGSIAARAGIRPGDLIVSANGEALTNVRDLNNVVEETTSDRGLRLLIEREGYRRFVILRRSL